MGDGPQPRPPPRPPPAGGDRLALRKRGQPLHLQPLDLPDRRRRRSPLAARARRAALLGAALLGRRTLHPVCARRARRGRLCHRDQRPVRHSGGGPPRAGGAGPLRSRAVRHSCSRRLRLAPRPLGCPAAPVEPARRVLGGAVSPPLASPWPPTRPSSMPTHNCHGRTSGGSSRYRRRPPGTRGRPARGVAGRPNPWLRWILELLEIEPPWPEQGELAASTAENGTSGRGHGAPEPGTPRSLAAAADAAGAGPFELSRARPRRSRRSAQGSRAGTPRART